MQKRMPITVIFYYVWEEPQEEVMMEIETALKLDPLNPLYTLRMRSFTPDFKETARKY